MTIALTTTALVERPARTAGALATVGQIAARTLRQSAAPPSSSSSAR